MDHRQDACATFPLSRLGFNRGVKPLLQPLTKQELLIRVDRLTPVRRHRNTGETRSPHYLLKWRIYLFEGKKRLYAPVNPESLHASVLDCGASANPGYGQLPLGNLSLRRIVPRDCFRAHG